MRNDTHLNPKRSFTIMLPVLAAECILLTKWRNSALKETEMLIMVIVSGSSCDLCV